jgi:lysophospholipase L1-like esterase
MERRDFLKFAFAGAQVVFLPSILKGATSIGLPNVLIIGDSISIGYTPIVKEMLAGKANVFRPMQADGNPENCSGTTKGVSEIDRWLGGTKWDVIHFNFGLHDLKHVDPKTGEATKNATDPLQADPDQYRKNLILIIEKLKKTGAKLIFATTTPYKDVTNPLRDNGMYEKYNQVAVKLMKKNQVEVNDLCSFILPNLSELQQPKNVHFTDAGYKVLAGEVVKNIQLYLK